MLWYVYLLLLWFGFVQLVVFHILTNKHCLCLCQHLHFWPLLVLALQVAGFSRSLVVTRLRVGQRASVSVYVSHISCVGIYVYIDSICPFVSFTIQ